MRIQICAVGRLRASPERELILDYLSRFDRTGRALSLGPAQLIEVEDKKNGGAEAEAELLLKAVPAGALICLLDERGKSQSSPEFSSLLARWRDAGRQDVAFIIGGADGFTDAMRHRADHMLSFGQMVWPHMLARVMLCEQLYRAASIEAHLPYHRS